MSAYPPVSIDDPPTDVPIGAGPGGEEPAFEPVPVKRNSIFPLMVDVGAVLVLFGLIIGSPVWGPLVGGVMMTIGGLVAVAGLVGWLVEARSDFRRMPD